MTELTPQLVEDLMNNVPPQQDFRQAVTIVSSDPGSVVYRIDVPQDPATTMEPSSEIHQLAC